MNCGARLSIVGAAAGIKVQYVTYDFDTHSHHTSLALAYDFLTCRPYISKHQSIDYTISLSPSYQTYNVWIQHSPVWIKDDKLDTTIRIQSLLSECQ